MEREEFLSILGLAEVWSKPEDNNKERIILWDKECIVKEYSWMWGTIWKIYVKCGDITLSWRSNKGSRIEVKQYSPYEPAHYLIASTDELTEIVSIMSSNVAGWEDEVGIWCETHLEEW